MTSELMQAYTARISQASRSELVVIMYEIILTDIDAAKKAFSLGNQDIFMKELKHAGRFLNELMGTLDYKYALSYELMRLYIYVNKRIITAIFQKDLASLDSAIAVLQKLLEGFREVSSQDTTGPVMQNSQQLYAGLTYGKGSLNEVYLDPLEQNRGFKI